MVGPNGAGKSTLLALIAGELPPSSGRIFLDPPGASVALCRQEVDTPTPEIEAFAEAVDGRSRRWMGRLDIDPGSLPRWDSLSPGERKRWQLAAALAADPVFLLLDEPTNHMDQEGRRLVEAALTRFSGVGLVISHDRAFMDRLTRRTLRVEQGDLRLWGAPYSLARDGWSAEEEAARERHASFRKEEKALRRRLADERRAAEKKEAGFKRKLKKAGPRDHDATSMAAKGKHRSGKAAGQKRRTVIRSAMERAGSTAAETVPEKALGGSIFFDYEPSPKRRLFHFSGPLVAGDSVLSPQVEADVLREDRIRLVGPNGAGKSTLLHALVAGSGLPAHRVLHLPQELTREGGTELLRSLGGLSGERRGRVLTVVAALGVDPDHLLSSGRPSPGEARKLALALGLGTGVWALVLDEPTNHLDLPAVETVESALDAYPGALVLVTHDQTFGERTTRTTWRMAGGMLRI